MKNTNSTMLMDLLKRPAVVGAVGAVLGLALGLLMGWVVWPVEYKDADFTRLRADLQREYVVMVASAYAADLDAQRAADRVAGLGPDAKTIVDNVATGAGPEWQVQPQDLPRVQQLQVVVSAIGPAAEPAAATGGFPWLAILAGCGIVLLLAGVGGFIFLRMSRGRAGPAKPRTYGAMPIDEEMVAPAGTVPGVTMASPPIARFMTTYTLGDDVYDDSFSIDGPDGNFLGECGMGISETIGVGDPKKVTAFEVWLFDKNDIRTVTKVIMSEHGFRDEALKSRLAAKGEPVQAESGDIVSLETATLTITARIVDMAYGGGALPPGSFFERMTIELQAFRKG